MTINRNAFPIFDKAGATERRILTYTGPASYATGGDSLTPESISLSKIGAVLGLVISDGTTVYWGWWDATNKKILWFSATATQVPNATNLATFAGTLEVIGR